MKRKMRKQPRTGDGAKDQRQRSASPKGCDKASHAARRRRDAARVRTPASAPSGPRPKWIYPPKQTKAQRDRILAENARFFEALQKCGRITFRSACPALDVQGVATGRKPGRKTR